MVRPIRRVLQIIPQAAEDHKNLLPFSTVDVIGSLCIGVALMIAASGGIGGGGILVPLLIIVFEFNPKHAIPLSNFTILGSSIANVVINLPRRHPDADRPLIDWDLILVMEPLTMAGAVSYYPKNRKFHPHNLKFPLKYLSLPPMNLSLLPMNRIYSLYDVTFCLI